MNLNEDYDIFPNYNNNNKFQEPTRVYKSGKACTKCPTSEWINQETLDTWKEPKLHTL